MAVDKYSSFVEHTAASNVFSDKQLYFLAYSLYREMKHDYLGKCCWVPISHCVVGGIHEKFSDSYSYVGFEATKFNQTLVTIYLTLLLLNAS
jgi:hypothetical protein